MSRRRRRVLARVAGAVGVVTQVLVGLMGIVIFPAAFVSFLAGGAGVRLVGRDLEAASMRFGVALLASGVGLAAGVASGVRAMSVTALVSTAAFGVAWSLVQHLDREGRAAFGIRHRDWERRNIELHERRERLVDGGGDVEEPAHERASHGAAAVEPGASGEPGAVDGEDWWADLD